MKKSICIIGVLLLMVSCNIRENKKTVVSPVRVKTMLLDQTIAIATRQYVGTVEEEAKVPLSMLTAGTVTEVRVKNGQRVRRGTILMMVDGQQAKNALQSAESVLRQAQDGYNRTQRLHAEGVVTDVKELEIRTKLEEARSAVAAAQKAVDDCCLTAPMDGIINDMSVHTGQNLVPGQWVMTLISEGGYKVRFAVPESEIADICLGDSGVIEVKAIRKEGMHVTVVEKGMMADRISHTYEVKAVIDTSVDGLMPGMVSKVRLKKQEQSGYPVPQSCVQVWPEGKGVWVVSDSKAERRMVETGGYIGEQVLIRSGLEKGDRIVVDGYQKLYNGCGVEII